MIRTLGCMGLLCFVAGASPVSAQDAEARTEFDAGRQAYQSGQTAEALVHLRRSLELQPRVGTAYNLAIVEAAAGNAVAAANLADSLLEGTYGPLTDIQREDAGALLASVENLCARLSVSLAGQPGAWLRVNGEAVPVAGSVTLRVAQGTHRIEVGAEGIASQSTQLALVNGERRSVSFDLTQQPGRLNVQGDPNVEVQIVGVGRGIGRVEAALDAGEYRVGPVGGPLETVQVRSGETRTIRVSGGEPIVRASRRGRRVAIALAVVGLVAAGAVATGVVLRNRGGVEPDPVFGVIEALRSR